jgi:hypothetical protein
MLEAGVDGVGAGGPDALADARAPSPDGPDASFVLEDAATPPQPPLDASVGPDVQVDAQVPVDAGVPADGGISAQPDAARGKPCDLPGRYALRFAFDVTWVGTEFLGIVPVIEAGQGELNFVVLMDLAAGAAGMMESSFRTCSSDVPEFMAVLSRERFQARIEDEVWDSDEMPLFASALDVACLDPGCAVSGRPLYALIGVELPAPDAPWPSEPAGAAWPDHDGDGADGVATRMLGPEDGSFAFPPLDLLSVRRLSELALGLRVVVGFDGTLDSCDEMSGQTTQSSIETRALSCTAINAPASCTGPDLEFLNNNLPVWTAHEGRFEAQRLPASADCDAARRVFRTPRR